MMRSPASVVSRALFDVYRHFARSLHVINPRVAINPECAEWQVGDTTRKPILAPEREDIIRIRDIGPFGTRCASQGSR